MIQLPASPFPALRIGVDATACGIAGAAPTGVFQYIRQLMRAVGRCSPESQLQLMFALPHPRHRAAIAAFVASLGLANASARRCPVPSRYLLRWGLPVDWFTAGLDVFHAPAHLGYVCRSCPQVVTVHDLAYLRDRGGSQPPAGLAGAELANWQTRRRFFAEMAEHMTRSLAAASRVITVSQATADDLVASLGVERSKLRVVHLGLREGFRPVAAAEGRAVLERLGLAAGYFLYVGLLDPNKNLATLLEGFAVYRRGGGRRPLVLAGHSNFHAATLRQLASSLGIAEAVRFTGFVADADLPALYGAARALVMPSPLEGFGLPAIEAMACGTPVIAADAGALPEVVGEAGVLAAHQEPAAFAAALEALDADPALHGRCAELGRHRAAGFTWEKAALETLAVYAELAGGAPASHRAAALARS